MSWTDAGGQAVQRIVTRRMRLSKTAAPFLREMDVEAAALLLARSTVLDAQRAGAATRPHVRDAFRKKIGESQHMVQFSFFTPPLRLPVHVCVWVYMCLGGGGGCCTKDQNLTPFPARVSGWFLGVYPAFSLMEGAKDKTRDRAEGTWLEPLRSAAPVYVYL
jgi:hypothetical protein